MMTNSNCYLSIEFDEFYLPDSDKKACFLKDITDPNHIILVALCQDRQEAYAKWFEYTKTKYPK